MIGYRAEQTITSIRNRGLLATAVLIRERLKKEGGARVPMHERWWLGRNGFKPISYVLYDFAEKNRLARADYLSDRGLNILCHVNGRRGDFLRNKLVFHRLLERIPSGIRVPKLLALIRARRVISALPPHSETSLDAILEENAVFVKPIDGARGHGVRLVARGQAKESLVADAEQNDLLVVERVEQAAYSSSISPQSHNTVRVVSMRRPHSREVFIPVAVHRFGTRKTAPVDNFSQGGLSCAIDIETGRLGPGKRHPSQTNWKMKSFPNHPDTDTKLEGKIIPRWQKLLENVAELMGIFPELEFAAWDILPVEDGWCVIEGNDSMDIDLLQVHGGLLVDERVRQFIAYHCPAALPPGNR